VKQVPVFASKAPTQSDRRTKAMKKTLHPLRKIRRIVLSSLLVGSLLPFSALTQAAAAEPEQPSSSALRDGEHDFDFNIGLWHTHIRRLVHPLTGSNDWVELDGTVRVRKVWNGRAQLEEIDAHGSSGQLEGLTLFLYNPQAHQWGQYFVSKAEGVLNQPLIGEFKNGRGELFDQESFNGRSIFVRFVWSDVTPDSHHVEQSFSDDGGKTWEPNFVATLTREKETSAGNEVPSPSTSSTPDGAHDFDFNFGVWKTHIQRLQKPLTGSHTWTDYGGTSVVGKIWGGRASIFELEANGPAGHIEGVGLRLLNPRSHQLSLNWANGSDTVMTTPHGWQIRPRAGAILRPGRVPGGSHYHVPELFSAITPNSSRFEQAFSDDAGKTWETNWIMTFTR
jgi:hypothetical protein